MTVLAGLFQNGTMFENKAATGCFMKNKVRQKVPTAAYPLFSTIDYLS
jgi:hypothetical protein